MPKQSRTAAALDLLVFGLNTDSEVGLRGASMFSLCHPDGMSLVPFSDGLLAADLVQYAFSVRPGQHILRCLFDHRLRLSNHKAKCLIL